MFNELRYNANWVMMLLPNLDQAQLYNLYQPNQPLIRASGTATDSNNRIVVQNIPAMLCPTDSFNEFPLIRSQLGSVPMARGNYGGNMGREHFCDRYQR